MKEKICVLDVSNLFIHLANTFEDRQLNNLKLNKLLFFAQGVNLAKTGEPLFPEKIEAWEHGPVVRNVYQAFKKYKYSKITEPTELINEDMFNAETINILCDIFLFFKDDSESELENMTRQDGTPWKQVYVKNENQIISNEVMLQYFKSRNLILPIETIFSRLPTVETFPADWDSEEDTIYDAI